MGDNDSRPVAVITGASSGVGLDLAGLLALQGKCPTVMVARSKDKLERAAEKISSEGGDCLPYAADISREEEVVALSDHVEKQYGRVNFLINNAGLGVFKPLHETSKEEWNLMHETMVLGTFFCTKYLLPLILKAGLPRHILINSSYWGYRGDVCDCTAYNSAKFAQRGLAQSLREELRKDRVKVTCLLPASIDTPFFDGECSWEHTPERILSSKGVAQVIYDILHYRGNLVVEEAIIQAIDPD